MSKKRLVMRKQSEEVPKERRWDFNQHNWAKCIDFGTRIAIISLRLEFSHVLAYKQPVCQLFS